MSTTMTCELFTERLPAYLEDESDAATRAAIERHAVTCVECGAVLADLRKLRIDAANLPDLAPSRDLWAGIAARIETPVVPISAPSATPRRSAARGWRAGVLAASLVGATAVGYVSGQRRGEVPVAAQPIAQVDTVRVPVSEPGAPAPGTPATRTPAATQVARGPDGTGPAAGAAGITAGVATPATLPAAAANAQLVVARLTADYDREIRQLTALLESRRNQLDPVTVAIIERNLHVIENAISECKQAIARDPASRFLIESLNQSLQLKVELMRTAATLPSRV